jgi:hypothetical protein
VNRRLSSWLVGLLAFGAAASSAHASTVLTNSTESIIGTQAISTALDIPSAGELTVTLTDMDFSSPFASLTFAISDATQSLTGLDNAGTITLDLTAPNTLFVNVFATSAAGASGLYSLAADFSPGSPVPLPSSAVCLGGAALMLLVWQLTAGKRCIHGFPKDATQATVIRSVA